METLLSGITAAVTTIVQVFVNFFQGLSEAFVYTPTGGTTEQLTFIGGVLVIGLVVMLAFMLLRWIISLVKGI